MQIKPDDKLSASLEDYLEAIYNLSGEANVARSKDIADALGVSRASVTAALKALTEKELVYCKPYGYTILTEKGKDVAERIVRRHEMLAQFFENILGAPVSIAESAACRVEHTLGSEITARLTAFIEFVSQRQDTGEDIQQQFQDYWQTLNDK